MGDGFFHFSLPASQRGGVEGAMSTPGPNTSSAARAAALQQFTSAYGQQGRTLGAEELNDFENLWRQSAENSVYGGQGLDAARPWDELWSGYSPYIAQRFASTNHRPYDSQDLSAEAVTANRAADERVGYTPYAGPWDSWYGSTSAAPSGALTLRGTLGDLVRQSRSPAPAPMSAAGAWDPDEYWRRRDRRLGGY